MPRRRSSDGWGGDSSTAYGSLTYQLREVGHEAASFTDFVYQIFNIIASTALVSALLVLMFIITSLMSYFGIAYLKKCPLRREIPFYLLIGGGVGMLKVAILFLKHRRIRREDLEDYNDDQATGAEGFRADDGAYTSRSTQAAEALVSVFLLVWFALGNYWVFSIYAPPFVQDERSPTPNRWCDERVYNFAVAQILICHSLLVAAAVALLLLMCLARHLANSAHWL